MIQLTSQNTFGVMLSLSKHDSSPRPESCFDRLSMTLRVFFLGFFLFVSAAFADDTPAAFKDIKGNPINRFAKEVPSVFEPKTPTPSRFFAADLSMPENFATTNNLAKKTGSFYRAFGEIIFVQGTITDSFNVPIDGVVVEIWQKNSAGKYHTLLEPDSEFVDKYFSMSGRTVTDNLGNYHFITIMPGSTPGRAPHININVYHPRFGKLETEMYFEKHPYNEGDYQFLSYSEDECKALTAAVRSSDIMNSQSIKLATFDIVLKGIHQYKRF